MAEEDLEQTSSSSTSTPSDTESTMDMAYYYYETFAQIYQLAELDHEIETMMDNWNIE